MYSFRGPITISKVLYYLSYLPSRVHEPHSSGEDGESFGRIIQVREKFPIDAERLAWGASGQKEKILVTPDQITVPPARPTNKEFVKFLRGKGNYPLRLVASDLRKSDFLSRSAVYALARERVKNLFRGEYMHDHVPRKPQHDQKFGGFFTARHQVDAEAFVLSNPLHEGKRRASLRAKGTTRKMVRRLYDSGTETYDLTGSVPLLVVYHIQLHNKPVPGVTAVSTQFTSRLGRRIGKQASRYTRESGEELWIALGGKVIDTDMEWRANHSRASKAGVKQRRVTYDPEKRVLHRMAPSREVTIRPIPVKVYASSEDQAQKRIARLLERMKSAPGIEGAAGFKLSRMWKVANFKVIPRRKWDQVARSYRETQRVSENILEGIPLEFLKATHSGRVY